MRAMWLFCSLALAQQGHDTWKTVETEHFRVHYPQQAEAWALHAAGQMDAIRANTSAAIGYAPDVVIDVVVMDPYSMANGWAMPSLRRPRMGLYASPPPADSVLGHYRSWSEDLITHEDAHLVHLMRPSRHGSAGLQKWTVGYGPVSRKSERWVAEGYATVIEGRLTGWGRPNSTGRQMLLHALARDNQMPRYGDLNLNNRWSGMGYAYLVGSAYLEWLEVEYGDDTLLALWTAMSANEMRTFDEAFQAVYGEPPAVLYDRFVVDLTARAAATTERTDDIWMKLTGSTGAPAVSPNGERLAIVNASGMRPKLQVYPTSQDDEAREAWIEARDERLEADPIDVAGIEPRVFAPAAEATRLRTDRSPSHPRWIDDERVLFTAWWADDGGQLLPDLYEWTVEGGERRVTRGQAVMNADPHPDGDRAVAVRTRWGASELVEVDLNTGEVTSLTEPAPDVVLDTPRYSPDGTRIAYLRNDSQVGWQVLVRSADRAVQVLDLPLGTTPTGPCWDASGDGLFVTFGQELVAVPLDGTPDLRLRRETGVLAPEVVDGEVWFLSVHADGLDLRRAPLGPGLPWSVSPMEPVPTPQIAEVEPGRYRPGRPTLTPIPGFAVDVRGWNVEGALHASDRAGRYDLLAWVSAGSDGVGESSWTGANVTAALHLLPVRLQAVGAALADQGSRVHIGGASVHWTDTWEQGRVDLSGGGWVDDRHGAAAFADLTATHRIWTGLVNTRGTLEGHGLAGTQGTLGTARGTLAVSAYATSLALSAAAGRGGLEDLQLAGRRVSTRPEGWGGWYIDAPGLIGGSLTGDTHRELSAELMTPVLVGVRAEHHRFTDDFGIAPQPTEVGLVSVVLAGDSPPIPMDQRPSVSFDAGAGCTVAGTAVVGTPCSKREHYRFWASATWTPRAE